MRLCIAIAVLALSSIMPAYAQQQQVSPPEAALQINGMVAALAQGMVQYGKTIENQNKIIENLQARIKELEPEKAKPK